MNIIYGEVVEILTEDGMRFGKIRVGGAMKKIPLELLTNAARGDRVLICDGAAISKVHEVSRRISRPRRRTKDCR